MRPRRITFVLTHPIQYFAPWFRFIAEHVPSVKLSVVYVTAPSAEQRGTGFDRPIEWGRPLLDGYDYRVVKVANRDDSVATGSFWGLGAPSLAADIAATRPDVVVIPGWQSAAYVRAILGCRLRGIPVLYRGDTHLGSGPRGVRRLLWRAKNWLALRTFDGYLTVGVRARQFLKAHGIAVSRMFPSPHAADHDFFAARPAAHRAEARREWGFADTAFVVLFAGKLSAIKRPLDAIRAVAAAGDACALIVGAGPLEDACREEARRLGVHAVFTGFLDQSQITRAYAAADCLVVPSESETWGFVVNEALAAGLPCVVSDAVGCGPDLITSPLAGAVFPMGDTARCVAAIVDVRTQIRRDPGAVSDACRQAVSSNSFSAAAEGLAAAAWFNSPDADELKSRDSRLLVCGGGLVTMGGAERMVFEIMRVAREHGAAVHVVVNDWASAGMVERIAELDGTWSYTWLARSLKRADITPLGVVRYAAEFWRSSMDLLRAAGRVRPTRVLVIDYGSALRNAFALALLRIAGIPVVMKMQNAPEITLFFRRLFRWLVNPLVSTFACNSRFTQTALIECGVPRRKTVVIYNTVPRRESNARMTAPQRGRIVYVGQVIPEKGVDTLLDAVEQLLVRGLDVSLDVIGQLDGWSTPDIVAFRARVRDRAAAPPLRGVVRLLGFREDVGSFLSEAMVHCCPSLPSIREAFGLVVLEAKYASRPSVVFASGGLPELVTHRVDGWICPDATAESLTDGLAFFLQSPEAAAAAGARAFESTKRFSRQAFDRQWWALFSDRSIGAHTSMSKAEVL